MEAKLVIGSSGWIRPESRREPRDGRKTPESYRLSECEGDGSPHRLDVFEHHGEHVSVGIASQTLDLTSYI